MSIEVQLFLSIILGLYSSVGLWIYSKAVEGTRRNFARIMLFVLAMALIIGLPLYLFAHINRIANGEFTTIHRFSVFMVWMITLWIYIIGNWKTISIRLTRHVDSK